MDSLGAHLVFGWLSGCGDVGVQDGEHGRVGEVQSLALRVWSGSCVARIAFGAAVHELVEDEDVDSAGDIPDESGHPVELFQCQILPQRAGCVVSAANPFGAVVAREVGLLARSWKALSAWVARLKRAERVGSGGPPGSIGMRGECCGGGKVGHSVFCECRRWCRDANRSWGCGEMGSGTSSFRSCCS
jgi:hypothetical protein